MTVLEYSKMVLEKVSFDKKLFKKELRKALRWIKKDEVRQLILWCRDKYNIKKYKKTVLVKV
jgi:hypothetical protein